MATLVETLILDIPGIGKLSLERPHYHKSCPGNILTLNTESGLGAKLTEVLKELLIDDTSKGEESIDKDVTYDITAIVKLSEAIQQFLDTRTELASSGVDMKEIDKLVYFVSNDCQTDKARTEHYAQWCLDNNVKYDSIVNMVFAYLSICGLKELI